MNFLNKNRGVITTLGWVALFAFIYFHKPFNKTSGQDLSKREAKTVVRNINNKEKVIEHYTKEVYNKAQVAKMLLDFKLGLMAELDRAKALRDTFQIVTLQDTIINHQESEIALRDATIRDQFHIINAQGEILEAKDTLIYDLKIDLKKVKRQRNLSLLGNLAQTAIIIFK